MSRQYYRRLFPARWDDPDTRDGIDEYYKEKLIRIRNKIADECQKESATVVPESVRPVGPVSARLSYV
jgi:hypothetical protein